MKYTIVSTIRQTCNRRKVLTIFINIANIDIVYSEYEKTFQKNIVEDIVYSCVLHLTITLTLFYGAHRITLMPATHRILKFVSYTGLWYFDNVCYKRRLQEYVIKDASIRPKIVMSLSR